MLFTDLGGRDQGWQELAAAHTAQGPPVSPAGPSTLIVSAMLLHYLVYCLDTYYIAVLNSGFCSSSMSSKICKFIIT